MLILWAKIRKSLFRITFALIGVMLTVQVFGLTSVKADDSAEIVFWKSIEKIDTLEAYRVYLDRYPNGSFSMIADIKIRNLTKRSEEKQTNNASGNMPTVSKKIPGAYKAKFRWIKGKHNHGYGGKQTFTCDVDLVIDAQLSVPERKIQCPGWAGYTEWYYRGKFNPDGTVKTFRVNHAYGTGRYSLMGSTKGMKPRKINNLWWNLYIDLEK